jgi:hypothetical protein
MPALESSHTVVPQHEHKGLSNTIDSLYIASVSCSANLRRYLCNPVGPIKIPFLDFYENFVALFTMTYKHKEMESFKEAADKIVKWAFPSNHITPDKCLKGIELFDEWQAGLFRAGLLSVRK